MADKYPSLKKLAGSLQKYVEKKSGGGHTKIPPAPKFHGGEKTDAQKFSKKVQSYLLQLNPAVQLEMMNKIQDDTPFMLIDPLRPREVNKIVYGHYDLMNFLLRQIGSDPKSDTFNVPTNFTKEALMMNKILSLQEDLKPSNQATRALNIISELEKLNLSHNELIKHPAYRIVYQIQQSLKRPQYLPVRTSTQAYREKHYLDLVREFHERTMGQVPSHRRDKKFIGRYYDVGADIDHVPKSQQKKMIKLLN